MALAQLQRFGHKKGLRVQGFKKCGFELRHQICVARDQAAFQQRGLHRHVFAGFAHAVGQGAHARTDLQPRVPAAANEQFYALRQRRVVLRAFGQEHQHVHVGIRKQLGAAIATHGQQGAGGRQAGLGPQLA